MGFAFKTSRETLAEYDAAMAVIYRLFMQAKTSEDVEEAQQFENLACRLVRLAFYCDTKDRNSLSACMSVTIDFVRECVASADK